MKKSCILLLALGGILTAGAGFYGYSHGQSTADAKHAPLLAHISATRVAATGPTSVSLATAPLPYEPAINAPVVKPTLPVAPVDLNQANPWTNWREFKPQAVRVTVADNLPLTFKQTSITTGVDGQTVWTGESTDAPGLLMVSSGTPSNYNAIVFGPDSNEYHIATVNGKTTVRELNPSDTVCGQEMIPAEGTETAAAPLPTMEGDQSIVDLLFVYSADYAATAGSAEQIRNEFEARVAALNAILANSKIDNMRWRAVGIMQAPAHTETSTMNDDVKWVTNNAEVAAKREAVNADQVLYEVLSDGNGYSKDYAGLGWCPIGSPTRSTSFAVVCGDGAILAAHELGHNFGCKHDRQTEGQLGNSTGYKYGHCFMYNGRYCGDVMSYAEGQPYYSNPDVSWEGNPMGIAEGQINAADNARWIREHAATMANLVSAPVAPTIVGQPTDKTLTAGNTLSLSVTATGSGTLSFQWKKDGAAISGATSSSFSKTNAQTTDSGSYTVTVTNSVGSVTSNAATVKVNAATVTPPTNPTTPTSSGGKSSGGGGAMGGSFLGALALLCGVRCALGRRNAFVRS